VNRCNSSCGCGCASSSLDSIVQDGKRTRQGYPLLPAKNEESFSSNSLPRIDSVTITVFFEWTGYRTQIVRRSQEFWDLVERTLFAIQANTSPSFVLVLKKKALAHFIYKSYGVNVVVCKGIELGHDNTFLINSLMQQDGSFFPGYQGTYDEINKPHQTTETSTKSRVELKDFLSAG